MIAATQAKPGRLNWAFLAWAGFGGCGWTPVLAAFDPVLALGGVTWRPWPSSRC